MEIDIELSKKGINQALKELRKLKKNLESNIQEAGKQLADDGANILRSKISTINRPDGNERGEVMSMTVLENSFIRWHGSQVQYLEFGTGVVYTKEQGGEYKGTLPNGYVYGSGAKLKANMEKGKKHWYYNKGEDGIKTEGIPAYAPMYNTAQELRKIAPKYFDKILTKGGNIE